MKVRFYCDVPNRKVRMDNSHNSWALWATTTPSSVVMPDCVRVAFDVDMPPDLVQPMHDVIAPADTARVVDDAIRARGET